MVRIEALDYCWTQAGASKAATAIRATGLSRSTCNTSLEWWCLRYRRDPLLRCLMWLRRQRTRGIVIPATTPLTYRPRFLRPIYHICCPALPAFQTNKPKGTTIESPLPYQIAQHGTGSKSSASEGTLTCPSPFQDEHESLITICRDAQAEKALSGAKGGFSWFGGREDKYMTAADAFIEAANAFKMQNQSMFLFPFSRSLLPKY